MSFTPYQIVSRDGLTWYLELKTPPYSVIKISTDKDELERLKSSLESDMNEADDEDLDAASAIYKRETGN